MKQGKVFTYVNKAILRSQYRKPKFKYGIEVPRIWVNIIYIDNANNTIEWHW